MSDRTKVLVIDDEESIRGFLREFLEGEGFGVLTAATADEALIFLGTQSFDVIMTDIRMPGLSGIDLLRQVQEFKLNCAVIIMTSYATYETITEAGQYGAFDYMKKPFEDLEYLLSVVRRAAEHRGKPVDPKQTMQVDQEQTVRDEPPKPKEVAAAEPSPQLPKTGPRGIFEEAVAMLSALGRDNLYAKIVETASGHMGGRPVFLFREHPRTRELVALKTAASGEKDLTRLRARLSGSSGSSRWYQERQYLPLIKSLLEGRWGTILFESAICKGPQVFGVLAVCNGSGGSLPSTDRGQMEDFVRLAAAAIDYLEVKNQLPHSDQTASEMVRDGLTAFHRLAFFKEYMEQEVARARRFRRPFSVCMAELEGLNEGPVRARSIKGAGDLIRSCVRVSDLVARSRDRFYILLPETPSEWGVKLINTLKGLLERLTREVAAGATVRLAIADYPRDGDSGAALMMKLEAMVARQQGSRREGGGTDPGGGLVDKDGSIGYPLNRESSSDSYPAKADRSSQDSGG